MKIRTCIDVASPTGPCFCRHVDEGWTWKGIPISIEVLSLRQCIEEVQKIFARELPVPLLAFFSLLTTQIAGPHISDEAGYYVCDFIHYSSLTELSKREERKWVLFYHMFTEADNVNFANGERVLYESIEGMVVEKLEPTKGVAVSH